MTLMELMVVMILVTAVLTAGAAALSTSKTDEVKSAATSTLTLLQRARNVATRQNRSVVVLIYGTGHDYGGGKTAGAVEAYLATTAICPDDDGGSQSPLDTMVPYEAGQPYETLVLTERSGLNDAYDGAGIGTLTPTTHAGRTELCVQPNGRIVSRVTGAPFAGAGPEDFAGNIDLWLSYGPTGTLVAGPPGVPRFELEIPYSGVARINR